MAKYVALLRAVNVGGTGKLPMTDLKSMCEELGFTRVETYIASGNVVFESKAASAKVKSALEARLLAYAGKPVGVMLRTAPEMAAILKANPFPQSEPKFTNIIFLDDCPAADALEQMTGQSDEELRLGDREIYVFYPSGMGRSKLKVPAAKTCTRRFY